MTRLETLATQAKAEGGGRKGLRYCGIGLFLVISKYGIAVFRARAVCGKFKFHVAAVAEISLCRGDLLLFHDKRVQILEGLAG